MYAAKESAYHAAESKLRGCLTKLVGAPGTIRWTTPRHIDGFFGCIVAASNAFDDMNEAHGNNAIVTFGGCTRGMCNHHTTLRKLAASGIAALAGIDDVDARRKCAKAIAALLELLNCFRDAQREEAYTSGWATWLATTFVVTGLRKLFGGDNDVVYYALVDCMVNHYDDPDLRGLAQVSPDLKLSILSFLAPIDNVVGGPTGQNATAVQTLRGLMTR